MKRQFPQTYRGKPPATKRLANGLVQIVIDINPVDEKWKFSDAPLRTESEYLDMVQSARDLRTPKQRLSDCVATRNDCNYDSQEIGVQCFLDGRWPEHTDLKCWWCLHRFDTKPFPCPVYRRNDGIFRIRGVFCGPSCAKSWAMVDGHFSNPSYVDNLINMMANLRGFCPPGRKHAYIPSAPPRTALQTFCGPEGLTIEQFRGLCAAGFDVSVLHPPYITEKQVIVAECDRMARVARQGRVVHVDAPDGYMVSATEYAKRKREGMAIFAGVGAKRLTDYLGVPPGAGVAAALAAKSVNVDVGHRGRVKKPFAAMAPMASTKAKRIKPDFK
jgi:hypothetical protein